MQQMRIQIYEILSVFREEPIVQFSFMHGDASCTMFCFPDAVTFSGSANSVAPA